MGVSFVVQMLWLKALFEIQSLTSFWDLTSVCGSATGCENLQSAANAIQHEVRD
jgi:hypothetical protein